MIAALILGSALLAASPASPQSPDPNPDDLATYREASNQAGRDATAHVRLALWCEAHGREAEKLKHLAIAVLTDPSNPLARGLLGLVSYRGRWKQPDDVATDAQSDSTLQARLAEYNARRETMPQTADAHWALGIWCEQKGLAPEALAHFTAVTRLDSDHTNAWHRLGCRKQGGRWISEAELAAERAEATAQREADARWRPRLKQWWRDWLAADEEHRNEQEETLAETLDHRAVPTVRDLFVDGIPKQQLVAVQLLSGIDSVEASHHLARLAVLGRTEKIRSAASEAFKERDPNDVIEPLVGLMHAPLEVGVSGPRGPGGSRVLWVEGERAILKKVYVEWVDPSLARTAPRSNTGFLGALVTPGPQRSAAEQLRRDVRIVVIRNADRWYVTQLARMALTGFTGEDLGPNPESWRRWLSDRQGYGYTTPTPAPKRLISRVSQHAVAPVVASGFQHSCFAAGTSVRTLLGPKPIETLRVGDQVLSEDPTTGALGFQPIVVVYHNPPNPTLKIQLGHEEIVTTPIHRFWRAGKGWVLARELEPGDAIRTVGGLCKVVAVESGEVQPVFNLELAEGHNFFVGQQGALVHDNSRVRPPSQPFDAPPALTALSSEKQH
jgi:hypothetical protein